MSEFSVSLPVGETPKVVFSRVFLSRDCITEVACLHLSVGDSLVSIRFGSGDEMIEFCLKHNFPFVDERQNKK